MTKLTVVQIQNSFNIGKKFLVNPPINVLTQGGDRHIAPRELPFIKIIRKIELSTPWNP